MKEVMDTGIFVAPEHTRLVPDEDAADGFMAKTNGSSHSEIASGTDSWFGASIDESPFVAKILIVDDHPENLLALEATLSHSRAVINNEQNPIVFVRATNGREALRKVLEETFAVILLDVQMPEMDGYETAELIRKRSQSQHTPIIFLTAVNTSELNIFQGYSLGAVDYIAKPFNPTILRAKVGVFVELYRRQVKIQRLADNLREQTTMLRSSNEELATINRTLEGLYHEIETKSEELRKLNEELEARVSERTKALERANKELWAAKDSAERANQTKDQFLAILSHELRTPLTPVLAIVQMMKEDRSFPAEWNEFVETIGRNVQLEARLIDDLLDLTRIANGKLELHASSIDLHRTIRETITICHDDIYAKRLQLDLELEASHTTIRADQARIQQVLWNLIKNAVKFTPEGGHVTIRTINSSRNSIEMQVIDTGIGIPREHLKTIFNAFEQGDRVITRRFGGMGLGLAITKALIEQHKGTIRAESEGMDKGTTIVVEIPLASDELDFGPPNVTTISHAHRELSGTLLLVEDNDDTCRALKILFERKGYRVSAARSVASAIETMKKQSFDLIVSDIGLPDGEGFEVIRAANAIRRTHGIAISGYGMDSDRRRSMEAGFDIHLVKPLNFDELTNAVKTLLTQTKRAA